MDRPGVLPQQHRRSLRGMAINAEGRGTGRRFQPGPTVSGTGKPGRPGSREPVPYMNAWDHYNVAQGARVEPTYQGLDSRLADVDGRRRRPQWRPNPASYVAAMLTPKYREYFVQEVKAYTEGRIWSAQSFCLPGGFFDALGAEEFIVTPDRVWTLGAGNGSNTTRWIYTDGTGHSPKDGEYAKWHGESIGFWNGDQLVVHTTR